MKKWHLRHGGEKLLQDHWFLENYEYNKAIENEAFQIESEDAYEIQEPGTDERNLYLCERLLSW